MNFFAKPGLIRSIGSFVIGALLVVSLLVGAFFVVAKRATWWSSSGVAPHSGGSLTASVKRGDLFQRVPIAGFVAPRKRLDVKAPYSGYVQRLYVKVGGSVRTGDPLVMFSPSLGQGETNFPVRASFPGVVTQVLKTEGEYIQETGEQNLVLRVDDLSQLFIQAAIAELDVAKVKNGQNAKIRISSLGDEQFEAEVEEVSLSAKDKEKWGSTSAEFQLKVRIKNKDARLRPGMSAVVDIETNEARNVLVLPLEYIQRSTDGTFVTLVSGEKRPVKLGLQTDEAVEIQSGLVERDEVRIVDFLNLPKVDE
ncbi:MAG: hypothetical protein C5B49_01495 [Bdellovibrio sp.]|nr:MAG: hypothetical protein C5B49_01495 [Bdellovibrio sp.]